MQSCFASRRSVAFAALLLTMVGACGRSPTTADEQLSAEFAIRSDVPYIRGEIVERRTTARGAVQLLVRGRGLPQSGVREASVTVEPGAVIRWAHGHVASADQLVRGVHVTVWITGPELRSLPPQVTGNGFILHPFW